MAGEVFISYRRVDEGWARLLHARLQAEGVDAWYDVRVGAGEDSKKLIVPVRIENVQPSGAFLYELASRNWVNAFENTEAKLGELAKSLAELVRSGVSDPAMLPFDRKAGDANPVIETVQTQRSWMIASVAALLALAAVGLGFVLKSEQAKRPSQTTAFFGFEVTGADPGIKATAAHATTEVFEALGAMRLPIAARSETLGAPANERFVRAARLGAVYALGGEVLGDSTQTTISIRLEDVGTRSTLWSQSVSGPVNETIVLPVRAATLATDTLRCVSSIRASLPKDDNDVVKLLPSVCRERRSTSLSSIPVFRDLQRAAPESAIAQSGFATAVLITLPDAPERARGALLAEAESAARRAMELDPQLGSSLLARYFVAYRKGEGLIQLEGVLTEGLKIAPDDELMNQYYSDLLQDAGRFEDALPYGRVAIANDPLSAPKQGSLANLLAVTGQNAEAEAAIEKIMTRFPSPNAWQSQVRNAILHGVGDPERLLAAPPALISPDVVDCWRVILAAYRSSQSGERRSGAETAKTCRSRGVAAASAVPVLAALGDLDGAFQLVSTFGLPGVNRNYSSLFWPSTAALRADPRFLPLVEKRGLLDYWQQTGTYPDVCATEKAPFCNVLNR